MARFAKSWRASPGHATTILTGSKLRPWTAQGFGSSFNKAKIDAKMSEQDLLNDLRVASFGAIIRI